MNPFDRLKFLRIAVCLGLLLGIVFSHELWFPIERTFPRVPVLFESMISIDWILSAVLVVSLVSLIFSFRPKIFLIFALVSLVLLIVFDQLRLQPWVYQYGLLLTVIALRTKDHPEETTAAAQIIIAGLYFWSGVQKSNYTFSHETLPLVVSPLQNLFPSLELPFTFLGISIALLEVLTGLGLVFRKTRNPAVCSALLMHIVILSLMIAKNYNSIVWLWNAALMISVVVLFWKNNNSILKVIGHTETRAGFTAKSTALAFVLLPVLSFFGWWDMYLSGALYSGNVPVAVIRLDEGLAEKLPSPARQVIFETKTSGEKMLPLVEWAMIELNVPVYPEERIFRQVARHVCQLTVDKTATELIIKERPAILTGRFEINQITCTEIRKIEYFLTD